MFSTCVRLPDMFMDAKELVENNLSTNQKVSLKRYGSLFSNLCDVIHYHIEPDEPEGYSNLSLVITYNVRVLVDGVFKVMEKVRNLRVLTSIGDTQWTYRMINKIWEGDYPSSVAVDEKTGEVFLFSIKMGYIELVDFGVLRGTSFEAFKYDIHDREPFKIKLDENAMFDHIDGAEGISHLKRNVYIELNCGVPIRVDLDLGTERNTRS